MKGGSGTTVLAAALAAELSRNADGDTVIADLAGDVPNTYGISVDAAQPGLKQWLASSSNVPTAAVDRLLVDVMPQLRMLPAGPRATNGADVERQAERLRDCGVARHLVVDAGVVGHPRTMGGALQSAADTSLLVLRPCYLAISRVSALGLKADGFVLIEEQGRVFDARDIEDVTGIPEMATLRWDPAVARLVDAGRTKSRLPRSMRPLVKLATKLAEPRLLDRAG